MPILIAVLALGLLMLCAYRGLGVILMAPLLAMLAVLLTDPAAVPVVFSGLFMDKVGTFLRLYLPVFLLGALFGKLMEIAGFAQAIAVTVIALVGARRAVPAIVAVAALLTYGGVSIFVAVFALYPFAAELFRRADLPKRLIPATIGLGTLTFTMDALPGTPQIQNIIPTPFFGTTAWAAPWLGVIGSAAILAAGLLYLQWRLRAAARRGETYGTALVNEPDPVLDLPAVHPLLAFLPLLAVGVTNLALSVLIPRLGATATVALPGLDKPIVVSVVQVAALWAVQGALLLGIATIVATSYPAIRQRFMAAMPVAVAGALLAGTNTAVEYGFGAVIAALPGFLAVRDQLRGIHDPLLKTAVSITSLAGITGSASGGMSIALAAMSDQFIRASDAAGIPREVLHRVAAMASGGMDTLPHNGAVITLLAVTGLTHRQSYRDILALTGIKTAAVFLVIAVYYLTGLV